jgi:predicted amidophosphoribosyltransferase
MKHFCVELKVCEGCGGLWVRAQNHGVYCQRCALRLSEYPAPRGRSQRGRKRKVLIAACQGGAQ